MWDETLIESMGSNNNGKRWLTVQIAAIVHAGVIAILAVASYWYVDAVSLPIQPQNIIPGFFTERTPVAYGIRHVAKPQPKPTVERKIASRNETLTQQQITPESESSEKSDEPVTEENSISDLPEGSPFGIPGADPNGDEDGGLGSGDGIGIGSDGPVKQDQFRSLGVEQPKIMHKVEPIYPPALLKIHRQGTVILEAVIDKNGDVQRIVILRADHPLFAQSAIAAVSQWKYRPALLDGKPISVYFTVTVQFKLR